MATADGPDTRPDATEAWIGGLGIRIDPDSAHDAAGKAPRSIGIRGLTLLAVAAVGGTLAAAFFLRDMPPFVQGLAGEPSQVARPDSTTGAASSAPNSTIEQRPAPAQSPVATPPRVTLEPRPRVSTGEAEAAFGMNRTEPAAEASSAPPVAAPATCAPAAAALGLCAQVEAPKEKLP